MVDNEVMMMARFSRSMLLLAGGLALSNACGQILQVLTKAQDGVVIVSNVIAVRFVPLTRD